MASYKLAPSSLTFLWEECRRCFYMLVKEGIRRPSTPMASVYTVIDSLEKGFFEGLPAPMLHGSLPPGVIIPGDFVRSAPITLPGCRSSFWFSGRPDCLVRFEDPAEGWGIPDFKTAMARDCHHRLYSRQLHAYAWCLENPAPGLRVRAPVSRLGIFCLQPVEMLHLPIGYGFRTEPTWFECRRDDEGFLRFLAEIVTLLDQDEPPPAAEGCAWCSWNPPAAGPRPAWPDRHGRYTAA